MNGWNKLLENIKNILEKANINKKYEIEYLTAYECEKKMVKNSLVYFHGHIYKVVEVGYVVNNSTQLEPLDDFNYINGAKLVDILNPKNKGIRTFQYLSSGTVYLIKFKQDNDLENINEVKNNKEYKNYEPYTKYDQYSPLERVIRKYIDSNMIVDLFSYEDKLIKKYGNDKPLTLYRGLNFNTEKDYKKFLESINSGYYTENNLSAWTTDEQQAKQFAITKPSYMEYMTPENWAEISKQYKVKERITGFIGIILKINIQPNQGIDLKDFSSENEVILTEGKYKILDVKKVLSFNDLLNEKENKLINFFENLDNEEYESAIKWLLHNNNEILYEEEIINYLLNKKSNLLYLLDAQKLSDNIRHKLFLIMLKHIKEYLNNNQKNSIDTFSFDYDKIIKAHFVNFGKEGWKMFLNEDIKTFCNIIKPIIKDTIDKVSNFYMKNIDKFPQIKWEVYNVINYFRLSNLENYYNQKIGSLIRQQWNKLQDKNFSNKLFQTNNNNLTKYIERTLKSLTLTESKNNQNNKPYKFIAYHGSVEDNLKLDKNRAFYLTEDYKLAKDFAYREVYNDGLYEGEIPIVYKFKGEFKNPYYLTENEYDDEGQDSNINYKKWVDMGVDGIVFASKGYSTYYIVIDPSTIKLIGKKYLPYDKKSLYRTDTNEDDSFDYKLNESVHFNDLAYNSAFEKFEELTVLKNPSVEWIKNELTKVDLRFIYNPYKNILYVWNGSKWMHGDVMEVVDMNLAKENNIIGVLSPSLVEVWSEISPNDDEEEAMMLSKKYAGKLFKSIYPFGYQIRVYS